MKHASPALLAKAVYGLPELFRGQIPGAPVIANPGCYATTTILALAPLPEKQTGSLRIHCGRRQVRRVGRGEETGPHVSLLRSHGKFPGVTVVKHRHVPEIEQALGDHAGAAPTLTFVPHLVPMTRGIHVTAYADLKKKTTPARLRAVYEAAYAGERFIRVLPRDNGRRPRTWRGPITSTLRSPWTNATGARWCSPCWTTWSRARRVKPCRT